MWDFILPTQEVAQEMLVTNRSKISPDTSTTNQKQKFATPGKEKTVTKKSKTNQTDPIPSDSPNASKTLVISDMVKYNIVEDMKKARPNITLHELTKLKKQHKILLRELKEIPVSPLPSIVVTQVAYNMGKPPTSSNKVDPLDLVFIGDRFISHVPPFLLTYEIFYRNVHNCLVDSGASSNIIPKGICTELNITPQKYTIHIVQLDRTKVEVLGEIASVSIRLSSHPKDSQIIDILVADIPKFYGLILSRDWSEKLHGYFETDWSHMWLPHNSKPNQIRVDRKKFMKYTIIELEGSNEPVAFTNKIIGNYLVESSLGSFNAQKSPLLDNVVVSQIENFSQTDTSKCLNLVDKVYNDSLF